MTDRSAFILEFFEIGMSDIARVGGKNASLGEMFNALRPRGVQVFDGLRPRRRRIGNCCRKAVLKRSSRSQGKESR